MIICSAMTKLSDYAMKASSNMKQMDMFHKERLKEGRLLQPANTSTVIDTTRNPDWLKKWQNWQYSPDWAYIILKDNGDGTGYGFSVGKRISTRHYKRKDGTVKTSKTEQLWGMLHRDGKPTISKYMGAVGKCADVDVFTFGAELYQRIKD